eukprot:1464456-Alexandrium_andersonii.AAC.1
MSASLVGSEMCIRDRFSSMHVVLRSAAANSLNTSLVKSGHLRIIMRSRPVSYTHLTLPTICSV